MVDHSASALQKSYRLGRPYDGESSEVPMLFRVEGAVGNGDGVFDATYDFGEGGSLIGTPEEVGKALARYLALLTPEDCRTMQYGTPKFFVQLVISPQESTAP